MLDLYVKQFLISLVIFIARTCFYHFLFSNFGHVFNELKIENKLILIVKDHQRGIRSKHTRRPCIGKILMCALHQAEKVEVYCVFCNFPVASIFIFTCYLNPTLFY